MLWKLLALICVFHVEFVPVVLHFFGDNTFIENKKVAPQRLQDACEWVCELAEVANSFSAQTNNDVFTSRCDYTRNMIYYLKDVPKAGAIITLIPPGDLCKKNLVEATKVFRLLKLRASIHPAREEYKFLIKDAEARVYIWTALFNINIMLNTNPTNISYIRIEAKSIMKKITPKNFFASCFPSPVSSEAAIIIPSPDREIIYTKNNIK